MMNLLKPIDYYIKSGEISKVVKKYILKIISPNMNLKTFVEKIESKIINEGGNIPFPVNINIHPIVAHNTPSISEDSKLDGKTVNIDFGVHIQGYLIDTAITLEYKNSSYQEVPILNKIFKEIKSILKPNLLISDLGSFIEKTIRKEKYFVSKELVGHSIERYLVHGRKIIYNYTIPNINSEKLLVGDVFTIEPFISMKKPKISLKKNKDFQIYKYRKEYFYSCKRWRTIDPKLVPERIEIIINKGLKPIIQKEETFIVLEDKIICLTDL